jgi:hypothetical protein
MCRSVRRRNRSVDSVSAVGVVPATIVVLRSFVLLGRRPRAERRPTAEGERRGGGYAIASGTRTMPALVVRPHRT